MPKYYCDYCDKYIQETRKLHDRTDGHKKNKEFYYLDYPEKLNIENGDWEYVISDEEKMLFRFLEKKVLTSIYKRFQNN